MSPTAPADAEPAAAAPHTAPPSATAVAIRHLAFLIPGNYAGTAPAEGLATTLDVLAEGEDLGYDSAWVRQRHLERGISSAPTFLAAATQRTRRIGLGAAVIQMGYENPWRLAEDLATVDVLSGGRLQVGLSAGPPPYGALLGRRLFDTDPAGIDFSHARIDRLRDNLRGDWLDDGTVTVSSAAGDQRARLNPQAPGLADRLWVGGGSLHSAEWAARQGYHLLIGNVTKGEHSDDFHAAQGEQLALYHRVSAEQHPGRRPRVALGRVIVPIDSADAATRRHYEAFAASRVARTLAPQGERRTLFPRDLVGSAEQIVAALQDDPLLPLVDELRLELPYDFALHEYRQILHDARTLVAPRLGWQPTPR